MCTPDVTDFVTNHLPVMDARVVQPMFPQARAIPVADLPYVSPLPTELPYETSPAQRSQDIVASLRSGAYMAPNWIYPCHQNSSSDCFTNVLDVKKPAIEASCFSKSQYCADAVTRGLLTGLQPLLNQSETLFPEERLL